MTVIFPLHKAKNVYVDLRVTVWAFKIVSTAAKGMDSSISSLLPLSNMAIGFKNLNH